MKWKLLILMGVLSLNLFADVKLQPIFGDNMVLQRNSTANFWGTANSGENINVSGSWGESAKTATDNNGKWKIKLKTPDAGGPFTVSIQGKNKITFKNVMSGEVWLCTGQSNMDCGLCFFKDTKEAIANANYPQIRFFNVRRKTSNTPLKTLGGNWSICSPRTAKWFSATGYFFGLKLYKELNIPIGLIECAWGGTGVETWTPWEKQNTNPRLIKQRKNAAKQVLTYDEPKEKKIYNESYDKYKIALKSWNDGGKKGSIPRRPRLKRHPLNHANYPSNLYNGMISPLAPYTVKGAIWYQGENNAGRANQYAEQLAVMVQAWREKWGQGNFPFYFVQLPGFQNPWTKPVEEASWALMREEFANAAKKIPNAGMAITIDIGEANDIHPQQKSKVGERLARLALNKDYGKKNVIWTGPIMKLCKFKDGKVIISFETGGSPLAARNGEKIKGFALYDSKSDMFVNVNAKIVKNDTLEVSSKKVKTPTIVYYAWAQNPTGVNLINKEGLPASPFRYGKKPEVNLLKQCMPEVEKEYELVYEIDAKNAKCKNRTQFIYKKNNSDKVKGPFKKLAYFLGLRDKVGNVKYAFVEMTPFTDDVKKIGVPDKASGARFQCPVKNVKVKSNVPEVKTGNFPDACNIEFWDCNYGGTNAKKIPGASNKFDFGDIIGTSVSPGYGSMQIHNNQEKQSIICFNNFKAGRNADVGIGNSKSPRAADWTFTKNANKYSVAELKVLIKK